MSEQKLSSEEVPPKFAEWLLAMGCPPEHMPSVDKISEMCRGQYYMVWRSLMEHTGPKDVILEKRLQVFNNDIVKCQKKNIFNELDVNMPKELSLWQQHTEQREQVAEAEARVREQRETLNQLVDKVSSKLAQRELSCKKLEDAQRRLWLLQQVSAELRKKRANLLEKKDTAKSLCCLNDCQGTEIKSKIDRCLLAVSRPATSRAASMLSVANPTASSSNASTNDDTEDQIASLDQCRGDLVFKQLYERRAGLCDMPAATNTDNKEKDSKTTRTVLAHTAALHCTLGLEAIKYKVHINETRKKLASALSELYDCLSGEECELLVLRCEQAHRAARSKALRATVDELKTGSGVFTNAGAEQGVEMTVLHNMDKDIIKKKEGIEREIESAAALERKTQSVKDTLTAMFNDFHGEVRFKGQVTISYSNHDSISSLRQFYEDRKEKTKNKMELSMDFDVSDSCSYNDLTENACLKFEDELKFYLNKFSLEKNRKLVLESGENVWIYETVQSSLDRLRSKWQEGNITTSLVCPSVCLAHNLIRLSEKVQAKTDLEALVRSLESERTKHEISIDISSFTEQEQKTMEKVKKQWNDNIINLQKTVKTLDLGIENLTVWSDNNLKQFISETRKVNGRSYKEYETAYLEEL